MKAWIVHDSLHGNGKLLAETIATVFREKMEVDIGHVKKLSPHLVAEKKPDIIVVGTAVRAFSTSLASKNWIRRLKRSLRGEKHIIPLGIVFITHGMKKESVDYLGNRFHKILDRGIAIAEVYPGWLSGQVKDIKGPLMEGTVENFTHIAHQILKNIIPSDN